MDLKFYLALLIGKIIAIILKLAGSGATAAPGLVALKLDPRFVNKFSQKIPKGSIIVSGTNGKTTTARLIFDQLATRYRIIHNRQGSNLLRGIASTLINKSSLSGYLNFDIAIWEVDEATLPEAITNISPNTVVLLNLFRDQLDRYGEVDTIRNKWQKSVASLPKNSTLILNADDPGISFLAESFKGNVIYFGVNDKQINLPQITHVADVKHCPKCSLPLRYSNLLSAHMGHYKCTSCNFKRPDPQISAKDLVFAENFSTSTKLTINNKQSTINYLLPGLYNVYNILAASAVASMNNLNLKTIKNSLQKFSTAFGRSQILPIGKKSVLIFLIKNPTGANEVLRVLSLQNNLDILTLLNDQTADGKDVSWIWDTDWEILKNRIRSLSVAGTRAWDMTLRLKYAGIELSKNNIYKEISYSIATSIDKLNKNDTLVILPTYTALLEVQKSIFKLAGGEKWHRQ